MKAKVASVIIIFVLTAIATLAWQTNTAKGQVVTKGLVSYWTFDEADIIKDETVKDAWGNNDGTITGKQKIVEGKVAECLKFDGIDDCVGVGDNPSLNFGKGDFSVEAWVQFNTWAVQKEYQTIEKTSGFENSSGWALEISTWGHASQKFGFIFAITTGPNWADNAFEHSEFSYDTGQWYHVVVTRSGSTCKLYVDGTFVVEETNGAFSKSVDNNVDLDIGKAIWDQYFKGLIDEVRIYNQALSESEVERNFAAEGLAVVSPTKKLALTWGEIKVSK